MYFSQLRVDPSNDKAVYVAGPAGGEVARRRPDVRDARRGGRQQLAGSRRSARHLDRSEEPEAPADRQRRRVQRQLGPGADLGLRQHDGDRDRLLGQRRHAPALLRLHRPPGQRQLGRAERHAQRQRHPQLRLVRHRRRRRVPDGRRSDRLQHRLHRVAGREHQPLRPAQRPRAEHPPAPGRSAAADVAAEAEAEADAAARAERPQLGPCRSIPLQLEHAVPALAAQPEHRLARRQPAVQVATTAATRGRRAPT